MLRPCRGSVPVALPPAAIPLTALNARAQDPTHKGDIRRGHTAGYGPLFTTLDQTTGLPLIALPEGFKYLTFGWTGVNRQEKLTPFRH